MNTSTTNPNQPVAEAVPHEARRAEHHNADAARAACADRARFEQLSAHLRLAGQSLDDFFAQGVAYAQRRGSRDPEDAAQKALIKAVEAYNPSRGRFDSLYWTILPRILWNELRTIYRQPPSVPLADEHLDEIVVDHEPRVGDRVECFQSVLKCLPNDQVEILLARHGREVPIEELAQQYGVSEGAMKNRLWRGRQALARKMIAAGYQKLEDVERFGALRLRRPVVLPPPRPARHQPRPSCVSSDAPDA